MNTRNETQAGPMGLVNWAIYDVITMSHLGRGVKPLFIDDIEISKKKILNKRISLDQDFYLSLPHLLDCIDGDGVGFGLVGSRGKENTFSWTWFDVDRPGHAQAGDGAELAVDIRSTPSGTQIGRMEFLTDVTISVLRNDEGHLAHMRWYILIFAGSVIRWPVSD